MESSRVSGSHGLLTGLAGCCLAVGGAFVAVTGMPSATGGGGAAEPERAVSGAEVAAPSADEVEDLESLARLTVSSVIGESANYTVTEIVPLFVEGERRGASAVLILDKPVRVDGPWIAVDSEHALRMARPELSDEEVRLVMLSHAEATRPGSGAKLTPDDYVTKEYRRDGLVDAVRITVDTRSGRVLRFSPARTPEDPGLEAGGIPDRLMPTPRDA